MNAQHEQSPLHIVDVPRPKHWVDAFQAYLNGVVLPKYIAAGKSLSRETLQALRIDVGAALGNIISRARFETTDDMLAWLSDQYFLAIEVNGARLEHMSSIACAFTSSAKLSRVPASCLRLYRDIYRDTDIGEKIEQELLTR